MSLNPYQNTQNSFENHRETEYRLFTQVTRSLMGVKDLELVNGKFHEALHWNRELWTALSTDCAVEGNGLPDGLRAQIISLSIWVAKYTSQVASGQGDIQDLIDINRIIMEGLEASNKNHPVSSMVNSVTPGKSIKV